MVEVFLGREIRREQARLECKDDENVLVPGTSSRIECINSGSGMRDGEVKSGRLFGNVEREMVLQRCVGCATEGRSRVDGPLAAHVHGGS